MNSAALFVYWLVFNLLVLLFGGIIIFAARRAGYVDNQDRARYLALWAEVPDGRDD